jgi:hypothetical protein
MRFRGRRRDSDGVGQPSNITRRKRTYAVKGASVLSLLLYVFLSVRKFKGLYIVSAQTGNYVLYSVLSRLLTVKLHRWHQDWIWQILKYTCTIKWMLKPREAASHRNACGPERRRRCECEVRTTSKAAATSNGHTSPFQCRETDHSFPHRLYQCTIETRVNTMWTEILMWQRNSFSMRPKRLCQTAF